MPEMLLVQVPALHVEIEGAFGARGLNAGNPVHLGGRGEVLEIVTLVDEDVVYPKLIEGQPVVFLLLGEKVFERFCRKFSSEVICGMLSLYDQR
jgi:hypothetical protein